MKRGEQAKLIRELESEHGLKPSKTIISRMIKEKDYRIKLTPKGNINIASTVKALLDSDFGKHGQKIKAKMDAKKGKSAETKPVTKKETASPPSADNEDADEEIQKYLDGAPITLKTPRSIIEKYKTIQSAEKDWIANEVKLKKLISLDDVSEKSFDLWRQVRDSIQSIKDRCAIKIRATESDHEAEQILQEETDRILNSIVDGFASLDNSDLKKKLVLRLTT